MSLKQVVSVAAAAVLACYSVWGVALAQDDPRAGVDVKVGEGRVSVDGTAQCASDKSDEDRGQAAHRMIYRGSKIQGMTVENTAGKELGTVKDVVIDVRQGQVKYAALSYGGFLGIGNKLFAVPWDAFEHRRGVGDDEHKLLLSIDEQTLKNAPGFDQSRWPNFADGTVAEKLEKHYRKFRRPRNRHSDIDVQAGPVAVNIDVERKRGRDDRRRAANKKDVVHRANDITGMTVRNPAGRELGSVSDLVVDMESGRVRYAALSYGGFLGLRDKLFAVPWDSFDCQYNPTDNEYQLVLAVDEAALRKAPGFDSDNWPNLADPNFAAKIDAHYGDSRRRDDGRAGSNSRN